MVTFRRLSTAQLPVKAQRQEVQRRGAGTTYLIAALQSAGPFPARESGQLLTGAGPEFSFALCGLHCQGTIR